MVDKKKIAIVLGLVILGVVKGPFLYRKVTEWYSQKTGAWVSTHARVGFGEYLLPSLQFDVLPSDCQSFFQAVLKVDLSEFRKADFSVTYASLPILQQGCVIPDDPYFTAVNRYAHECLSDKTESKEVVVESCVRALMNLRASIVDRLFSDPKYSEITDVKLLANLAFAAFVKLDAHALTKASFRLKELQPNSYTAAKWYAFGMVLISIEYGGSELAARKAIDEARDLYDQGVELAGLEVFLASKGFKDSNGLVAAKRMLESYPKSAEARAWTGYYQWMLGNRENALVLYREAASLEPTKKEYLKAIQVLEENAPEDEMVRGKFFPVTWNQEDLK